MDDMIVLIQSGVGIACVLVLWIKLGSYLHRKGFDWASTIGLVLSITLLLIAVFYYWIFSLFPLAQFGFILAGIPLVLLFLTVILWNMISLAVFSKLREPPKIRATIIMLFILGIVYLLPLRQGPLWVEFLVGYRARVAIVKEIKAGNFSYLKSHYNGKFYELPVFNKYYCWKCGLIELVGPDVFFETTSLIPFSAWGFYYHDSDSPPRDSSGYGFVFEKLWGRWYWASYRG